MRSHVEAADKEWKDPAVRRVFGFFHSIGLLTSTEKCEGNRNSKLSLRDVIRAGELEPRIYEVLGAALFSYPRSFRHHEALPRQLAEMIDSLHAGDVRQDSYRGITYQAMQRWMYFQLPDKRTKPLGERCKTYTFSLFPETYARITELAEREGVSRSEFIRELVGSVREKGNSESLDGCT